MTGLVSLNFPLYGICKSKDKHRERSVVISRSHQMIRREQRPQNLLGGRRRTDSKLALAYRSEAILVTFEITAVGGNGGYLNRDQAPGLCRLQFIRNWDLFGFHTCKIVTIPYFNARNHDSGLIILCIGIALRGTRFGEIRSQSDKDGNHRHKGVWENCQKATRACLKGRQKLSHSVL